MQLIRVHFQFTGYTANVDSNSENNSGGLITFNQVNATSNITSSAITAEIGQT